MKWYLHMMGTLLVLPQYIIVYTETKRNSCRTPEDSEHHTVLNCSYTDLSQVAKLDDLQTVAVLDLSHCGLETLPTFVNPKSLSNIAHLNLSANNIIEYPKYLNDFKRLRTLNLSCNDLSNLFVLICGNSVEIMALDNNKVNKLQIDQSCMKLKELYMQNNLIQDIVVQRDEVDEQFYFDLETLNLSGNKLTHITGTQLFALLLMLQNLYLAGNSIVYIEESAFELMKYLERIDLSNNSLEYIPVKLLSGNEYLKFLDLSGNRLQTIPSKLPILEWLDVSFNNISTLKEDFNVILYPVRVFLIGGNPFKCTCEILWLKELFNVRKYLLQYLMEIDSSKFIPACEKPVEYKGILWDRLEDTVFDCPSVVTQDIKATNEEVANVLNNGDILKASDISHDSIALKWNLISTVKIDKIEISYHPFGKKKDIKRITITSVTRHLIQDLKENTPYIVCLSVTLEAPFSDCIEVMTIEKPQTGILYIIHYVYHIVKTKISVIAFVIGIATFLYIVHLLLSE